MRTVLLALVLSACGEASISPPTPDAGADASDGKAKLSPVLAFVVDGKTLSDGAHALFGARTAVHLTGVAAGSSVTLHAYERERATPYESRSTFPADATGTIDTGVLAPSQAAYAGVDVDGTIWSASATKTAPAFVTNGVRVDAEQSDGTVIASATLQRDFVSPTTTRTPVTDNGLVGVFYAPNDGLRHPAIVAFGGSEGGLSAGETFAAYFSARGYAALGLAYFADGAMIPAELSQVPLEYFGTAMKWLDSRSEADATKLAVVGGSRGGELALLLGATFPRVKAVVAYVPSGLLWGAPDTSGGEVASWTLNGKDLPFLPVPPDAAPVYTKGPDGKQLLTDAPLFLTAIQEATPAQIDLATTRVEKTQGPILMLGGQDDQVWQSCTLSKYAMDRLTMSGHAAQYGDTLVCYQDDGHNIGFPGLSTMTADRVPDPYANDELFLGGKPAGIARASRDADDRVMAFLASALK